MGDASVNVPNWIIPRRMSQHVQGDPISHHASYQPSEDSLKQPNLRSQAHLHPAGNLRDNSFLSLSYLTKVSYALPRSREFISVVAHAITKSLSCIHGGHRKLCPACSTILADNMPSGSIPTRHITYNLACYTAKNVVGAKVRQARKLARPPVTQSDLAACLQLLGLNVDQPTISKIEQGLRPVLDIEVVALAGALKVSAVGCRCAWKVRSAIP
jgi:hypothetical protein